MGYNVITTEAFILRTVPESDADIRAFVLGRNVGIISVLAKGALRESSKLRMHIAVGTFARISVVRGKGGYKLVGISNASNNSLRELCLSSVFYSNLSLINNILLKITPLDEVDPEIFDIYKNFIYKIHDKKNKILLLAGILSKLGYFYDDKLSEYIANPETFNNLLLSEFENRINKSLRNTHLL